MIRVSDCRGGWLKNRDFNLELRTRIYVENPASTVATIPGFICILLVWTAGRLVKLRHQQKHTSLAFTLGTVWRRGEKCFTVFSYCPHALPAEHGRGDGLAEGCSGHRRGLVKPLHPASLYTSFGFEDLLILWSSQWIQRGTCFHLNSIQNARVSGHIADSQFFGITDQNAFSKREKRDLDSLGTHT